MPSSDSDSLPDLASVLNPPNRKRRRPRPNGTAKASEPIELTSDDEPIPPWPKRKRRAGRKSSSENVIDLCSDDHEVTPRSRKTRKSQAHAPREDEIIVLMSSDNEEPPASCSKPSSSKTMNSDSNSVLSSAASMPPIEILRPEENNLAADTGNASEQPQFPTPQMGSSPASPVADVHEAQPPTDQQAKEDLPNEDGMTSGPLQHIYNEAFQNTSQCDEVDIPSPVFSWKTRLKPIQVCEPHPLPSSNSPLLTPGFFKRVQEALSVPQNSTTSVENDLVKGTSPDLQRPTTSVKSDLFPCTPFSVTPEVGERESPKLLSPEPSLRNFQAECVIAVEEIANNPPGVSPAEVVEAGALHTASPSSPVKEPSPSTPQSEFTGQSNTFNVHDTTNATCRTSPSIITTSKTVPKDSQQINAFGPSEADIQEIEAMLLPEASNDMTDQELLAIGLCYPEF